MKRTTSRILGAGSIVVICLLIYFEIVVALAASFAKPHETPSRWLYSVFQPMDWACDHSKCLQSAFEWQLFHLYGVKPIRCEGL
jgi:hypothetical protein